MTRFAAICLGVVAILAGVAGALLGSPWSNDSPSTNVAGAPAAGDAAASAAAADPTLSIVATAIGAGVAVHQSVGSEIQSTLTNPIQSGAPLTFLVREQRGTWLRVLLPLRPNGATGWIRTDQVRLSSHHYKIVVQLAAHRLTVLNGTETILDTPVGVGKTDTPTPGGLYYTKELLEPPNPNGAYGHFTYGLSGFSNVITSFQGGDGVIGIHGTNDPSSIGKDVSHGCLRISNDAIDMLAKRLPLGVPVEIDA
jgi:lipoprotein-anchoring transpeptidase ErfK/SrfK